MTPTQKLKTQKLHTPQGRRWQTEWMGTVPAFTPDAPPRDWERRYAHAERATIFAKRVVTHDAQGRRNLAAAQTVVQNRPVPRLANCQYASDTERAGRDAGTYLLA